MNTVRSGSAVLVTVAALVLACAAWAAAADWPQWRGPERDGEVQGLDPSGAWLASLAKAWSAEVGDGYSGPVVAAGRIVVLARQGDDEILLALDAADGREMWRRSYTARFTPESYSRKHGKGPFATPTIAGGRVYAVGITGIVHCVDLRSGKVVWRRDFGAKYKKPYPIWGTANSPLIDGTRCILGVGSEKDGAVAALDAATGKTVWKIDRFSPSYSSAVAADLAGRRQVVILTRSRLAGVEPDTGEVLWEIPYKIRYEQNIITPVVEGNIVYCSGYQEATVAVRVEAAAGGGVTATRLWQSPGISFFMSNPVLSGKHLFGLAQKDKGSLVCVDTADGKQLWSSPGRMGEYVSLATAKETVLVLTTEGELLLVAADPGAYRVLGRRKLVDGPVWAHLAAAGPRLYIRHGRRLTVFAPSHAGRGPSKDS